MESGFVIYAEQEREGKRENEGEGENETRRSRLHDYDHVQVRSVESLSSSRFGVCESLVKGSSFVWDGNFSGELKGTNQHKDNASV